MLCRLLIFDYQTTCNSSDVPAIQEVLQVTVFSGSFPHLLHLLL